jgi:hypothetical protein
MPCVGTGCTVRRVTPPTRTEFYFLDSFLDLRQGTTSVAWSRRSLPRESSRKARGIRLASRELRSNETAGGKLKTSIIATLICVPFAASAQKLLVEYEGTVSSIDRGSSLAEIPPYAIGDPIGGSLLVDMALAPRDIQSDDPQIGRYSDETPGVDFILGPAQSAGRAPADFVLVYNDWEPPSTGASREDGIIINDSSFGMDGDFNVLLGLQRPNPLGQLFADDGLMQSFDVEPEAGMTLWGYIERGFGEFWRIVNFTVDRFSVTVTPGVCRP